MFSSLITLSRQDYQYHPVHINDPDDLKESDVVHVPNIRDHMININDLNPKIFDITDIDFRIAEFLKTKDLTRFFSISKGMQTALTQLPQITEILHYNRSEELKNWMLLCNYQYDFLERKRTFIQQSIKNKTKQINDLWNKPRANLSYCDYVVIFGWPTLLFVNVLAYPRYSKTPDPFSMLLYITYPVFPFLTYIFEHEREHPHPLYFSPGEKNFFSVILSLSFICPYLENRSLIPETFMINGSFFYLSQLYIVYGFLYSRRPILIEGLKKNASKKIKIAYNHAISCNPQLIKTMAQTALTKIKTTFQSIGSFFARISAPHIHAT